MTRVLALIAALVVIGCEKPVTTSQDSRYVVAFTAEWCAPCQQQKPALAALPVPVQIVDVDRFPELADAVNVTRLPDYLIYDRTGRLIARVQTVAQIRKLLDGY